MQQSYRRFVIAFLLVFMICVGTIMGAVYVGDPYVYYHKDSVYKRTFIKDFNMRYQMPGMIRHLPYETVFAGTSMVHNFKESEIDKQLNTKSLNISISGSTAREQAKSIELALESKEVKSVYWEINFDSLSDGADRIDATFPTFLYDRNIWNDFPYLLSIEALKRMMDQIKIQDQVDLNTDPYTFYKFDDNREPMTVETMQNEITKLGSVRMTAHTAEGYIESFEENILTLVKKYPDTEFVFFYTPYPIARHAQNQAVNIGMNEARFKAKSVFYKELSQFDHVKVYDFQDEKEITYKASNYMDQSHYFTLVNDWMLEKMATEKPIQSAQEYEEKSASLKDQIKHFSYSQLTD